MLTDGILRLRSLFKRDAVEQDLNEELRFRFDALVESHVRRGLARDDAERRSRLEFGEAIRSRKRIATHEVPASSGIRIIEERAFTARDDSRASSVAIVSQTLAERYWPNGSAIGQPLRTEAPQGQSTTSTIVGVVADIRSAPHAPPRPIVCHPFQQAPPSWLYITVEGSMDSLELLAATRRAVWSVDPEQSLDGAGGGPWTLDGMLSSHTAQPRLVTTIGNALAAIAFLLAMVGLYGLLSYAVARRTSEIGVRMALGARRTQVLALVLYKGMRPTVAGIALRLVGAAAGTRLLDDMLFGITPLDPLTFVAVALMFGLVAMLACCLPARRAMKVDPMLALRHE